MTKPGPDDANDRLIIQDLELKCVLGAEDWERLMPQRVVVDIELQGDFSAAAESDDLANALDYRTVCSKARDVAESGQIQLVETLADRIAQASLEEHECIVSVKVAVFKPLALGGFSNARATVEVTRKSA